MQTTARWRLHVCQLLDGLSGSVTVIEGRDISDNKLQINSLDGLRGLAVLAVFLSHTSNKGIFLIPNADFSGIGKSGVFLFFVLSAFLLTRPFIEKGKQVLNGRFAGNYVTRRFLRIYPLYFLYLTLGLVTSSLFTLIAISPELKGVPFYLSGRDFWEHILLVQGKGVTWSILVECRYYLVLPVLGVIYSVVLKNRVILSASLTAVLILAAMKLWPGDKLITNDPQLGPYLPTFFMGSFLAVVVHAWHGSSAARNRWAPIALDVFGVLSLSGVVAMTPSVMSAITGIKVPFNYYHHHYVQFALLWFVVVFACVSGHGALRKVFELPFLRYLGFVSFSFYLIHVIVIAAVNEAAAGIPFKGWVMFGVTIAVSHLSWILIEKPTSKVRLMKKSPQLDASDMVAAGISGDGTLQKNAA